jgi:hypothetical protein
MPEIDFLGRWHMAYEQCVQSHDNSADVRHAREVVFLSRCSDFKVFRVQRGTSQASFKRRLMRCLSCTAQLQPMKLRVPNAEHARD